MALTASGPGQALKDNGINIFRGIPFGVSPVGILLACAAVQREIDCGQANHHCRPVLHSDAGNGTRKRRRPRAANHCRPVRRGPERFRADGLGFDRRAAQRRHRGSQATHANAQETGVARVIAMGLVSAQVRAASLRSIAADRLAERGQKISLAPSVIVGNEAIPCTSPQSLLKKGENILFRSSSATTVPKPAWRSCSASNLPFWCRKWARCAFLLDRRTLASRISASLAAKWNAMHFSRHSGGVFLVCTVPRRRLGVIALITSALMQEPARSCLVRPHLFGIEGDCKWLGDAARYPHSAFKVRFDQLTVAGLCHLARDRERRQVRRFGPPCAVWPLRPFGMLVPISGSSV